MLDRSCSNCDNKEKTQEETDKVHCVLGDEHLNYHITGCGWTAIKQED